MRMPELKALAREHRLRGYSRLRKAELIELIRNDQWITNPPLQSWERSMGLGNQRGPMPKRALNRPPQPTRPLLPPPTQTWEPQTEARQELITEQGPLGPRQRHGSDSVRMENWLS